MFRILSTPREYIDVNASIRENFICLKSIIFGYLALVLVKMVNISRALSAIKELYVMRLYRRQKLLQKIVL